MTPLELVAALDRLGSPRALVVGDVILDRYTWGDAERVSQEAPVILLRAERREARLGGAANVANMLRGLEAAVDCVGVVGDDPEAALVRRLLEEAGVGQAVLVTDPARPTTVKERFLGRAQGRHAHQMLRVDSEVRTPLAAELAEQLAGWIAAHVHEYQVVLVSDYDKGVCTPGLLWRVIDAGRSAGVPVLVDPIRGHDYSRYFRATSMTPNRLEAGLATGRTIERAEDAFAAGRALCRQLQLDYAVITLDRDGMALVYPDGPSELFPTRPRQVYDITGAGDMALAMIGLAVAGGAAPPVALRLANVAAGMEVEQLGVVVVPRREIRQRLLEEAHADGPHLRPLPVCSAEGTAAKICTLEGLMAQLASHRGRGERIVFTNGCFDLVHVGHVSYLEEARAQGDVLVVGLNSDASVRRLKGSTRPVVPEQQRARVLAGLAAVDYVVVFHEDTPYELIRRIEPDVLVKGGDYRADAIVGAELVLRRGGRVHVTGQVPGVSTTQLLAAAHTPPLQGPHFPLPGAHTNPAAVAHAALWPEREHVPAAAREANASPPPSL